MNKLFVFLALVLSCSGEQAKTAHDAAMKAQAACADARVALRLATDARDVACPIIPANATCREAERVDAAIAIADKACKMAEALQ